MTDNTGQPRPSKTQLKREMLELQRLGEALIEFRDADLAALNLPQPLLDALELARQLTKRGALHRQKQYIGKLMRNVDSESIRVAVEQRENRDHAANAHFHLIERWRDRLINEGDDALAEFLNEYPDADRQHLRALIRNAAAGRVSDTAPRAARLLFKYLRGLM